MISLSEIRQLTTQEKLDLIETVWQELSLDEKEVKMPQRHRDMLDKRAKMIKEGKADFLDWEDAKKQIEKAVQ